MTHKLGRMREELSFILVNLLRIENRFHTWDEIRRYLGLFRTLSLDSMAVCYLCETIRASVYRQ